MRDYWFYAMVAGIVVIALLAAYAAQLFRQLAKQKKQQQQSQLAHQQGLEHHDHKVLASVLLISRAMQAKQCDYSEGCWRLAVLLDSLKTSHGLDQQFPAIFKLYNKIKHLTILDKRKQLPKKQRMQEDFQRLTLEAALYEEIVIELDLLQQYTNERMSMLSAPT